MFTNLSSVLNFVPMFADVDCKVWIRWIWAVNCAQEMLLIRSIDLCPNYWSALGWKCHLGFSINVISYSNWSRHFFSYSFIGFVSAEIKQCFCVCFVFLMSCSLMHFWHIWVVLLISSFCSFSSIKSCFRFLSLSSCSFCCLTSSNCNEY